MDLPSENQRVKQVIDYYCNGNESQFSKDIGISQPRINRLFRTDKRSGKYPEVSADILKAIINKFVDVSVKWLLTGEGEMMKMAEREVPEAIAKPNGAGIPLLPFNVFAGLGETGVAGVPFEAIEDRYVIPLFKHIKVDFMLPVRGSSMYPKYSSGDVVGCLLVKEFLFIQWSKVYVLDTTSQGTIMKRLKKSTIKDCVSCVSDNKDYDPFDLPKGEIRNIALVVGVIRLE